jgi:DNA-binding CsgD family transcriptional regulator/tetratricopeptide (TPR) repeat protein
MDRSGRPGRPGLRGRQPEWQAVLDLLRRAKSGHGSALLVEGEPGMGKTVLLAETARQADAEGFSVAIAAGHELSRLMPLAPVLTALGESPRTLPGNPAGGPDATMWLMETLRTQLEQRARAGPALVSLDDLQWADPATLLTLRALPSRLASLPLAWMLARRSLDRANDAEILFDLLESEGAARLRLGALDDGAVAELITDALGAVPEARLLSLAAGAAGNPSMLVELIGGLLDEKAVRISRGRADLASAHLPRRTRMVVRSWMQGLSPRARQLVETAAILGKSFSLDDAAAMLGESPAALLAPVEEALAAGVLVARQDTLAFRQELVRQAITENLPPPIRQALHRQAGEMLLALGDFAAPAAAAHLVSGARRGDAAALAGLDEAATKVLPSSPETAAQLATRALDLTRPSDPKRVARSVTAAEALLAAGRLDEAAELVQEALAGPLPDLASAQLRCVLSCVFSQSGQPAEGRDEAEKVLARQEFPDALRDSAHIALLRALIGLRDNERAADLATAVLVRRHDGRSRVVVAAAIARALIMWDAGRVTEGLQVSREAALREVRRPPDALGFHPNLFLAARLADVRRFDEAARIMQTTAGRTDASCHAGVPAILAVLRARMHLAAGQLDAAATEIHAAAGIVSKSGSGAQAATASAILGAISLRRGELAAAATYIEGQHKQPSHVEAAYEQNWHALVAAQIEEARAGARTAMDMLTPVYAGLREHRFLLIYDPASASWLVRLALANGDRQLADLAAAVAGEVANANPSFPVLTAAAAHARGIADEDLPLLSHAADRHDDWWARASAAEDAGALLAEGAERQLAVARLDQALTGYQGCGATRDAARVRRRLRKLGQRRRHWRSAHRPVTGWASLTDTERATSQLAAQGLTNQQIADQMYLSMHTVAFHLRAVYRKLGIRSRVELTRLVMEQERRAENPPCQKAAAHRPNWPDRPARSRSIYRSP